jgi:hypothetical protein
MGGGNQVPGPWGSAGRFVLRLPSLRGSWGFPARWGRAIGDPGPWQLRSSGLGIPWVRAREALGRTSEMGDFPILAQPLRWRSLGSDGSQ